MSVSPNRSSRAIIVRSKYVDLPGDFSRNESLVMFNTRLPVAEIFGTMGSRTWQIKSTNSLAVGLPYAREILRGNGGDAAFC